MKTNQQTNLETFFNYVLEHMLERLREDIGSQDEPFQDLLLGSKRIEMTHFHPVKMDFRLLVDDKEVFVSAEQDEYNVNFELVQPSEPFNPEKWINLYFLNERIRIIENEYPCDLEDEE